MIKFFKKFIDYCKNRMDLIFAIMWFWVMVFDLINRDFNDALMAFIIIICSLEIFILKSEGKNYV